MIEITLDPVEDAPLLAKATDPLEADPAGLVEASDQAWRIKGRPDDLRDLAEMLHQAADLTDEDGGQ